MAELDSTYDPNAPEQRGYARQVADQERQQRRQSQAQGENRRRAEGEQGDTSRPTAGQVATAQMLQFAWRFYIPTFTASSIYIVLHILLRYVFKFQVFCRAHEGSPLAPPLGAALAQRVDVPTRMRFSEVFSGSGNAGRWAKERWEDSSWNVGRRVRDALDFKKKLRDSGASEGIWIVLGLTSAAPLVLAALLLYAAIYTLSNPLDAATAVFKSVLGIDGATTPSGGGGASGSY